MHGRNNSKRGLIQSLQKNAMQLAGEALKQHWRYIKIVGEATYQAVDDMACVLLPLRYSQQLICSKKFICPYDVVSIILVSTTTSRKKLTTVGR